jgi:pilus assembly protein CpaB
VNRRILGLVGALLLAAIGTVMIASYVHGADARALDGQKTVKVYVVKQLVAPGTASEQLGARVALQTVVQRDAAVGAVTNLTTLKGRVTGSALVPGTQLLSGQFVDASTYRASGSGVNVPPGMMQTTIKLDPERALGGLLTPGAHVAVVASFDDKSSWPAASSGILLQNVLVTNVQLNQGSDAKAFNSKPDTSPTNGSAQPGNAPNGQLLVTLAIDAPSLERLVFAAERGTLWLSVEPDNAPPVDVKTVTRSNEQ